MRDSLKTKLIQQKAEKENIRLWELRWRKKSEGKTRVSLTLNESPLKF